MESSGRDDSGHLDAAGDREVVFCHNCSNEWYRDQHGLECPRCESDITEIISIDNDPRELEESSDATTPDRAAPVHNYGDSDPDEADIEDHMEGQNGFAYHRSTRQGPNREHHNPEVPPVIHRFYDMLHDFGVPDGQPNAPSQYTEGGVPREYGIPQNPQYHHHHHHHHHHESDHTHSHTHTHGHSHEAEVDPEANPETTYARQFGQGRIHRTTFRSGPFGTASVTIFSGPVRGTVGGNPSMEGRGDPFQEIFASVMRDIGPPEGRQPEGPSPAFLRGLQDILGLLNPANAMAGDAVYSQEALDRIISQLMEANPQSNAAPPASEEALNKLDRRCVDKEMLSGDSKTECSICIDDLKEGEKAIFLPCKHWFHEDCVVLWLKEHNTCPICRTPIEKSEPGNEASSRDRSDPTAPSNPYVNIPETMNPGFSFATYNGNSPGESSGLGRWLFGPRTDRGANLNAGYTSEGRSPSPAVFSGVSTPGQSSRPPSRRHTRLNEALRSVSSMQERQRDRDRDRDRDQGTSSGVSYDTSRMQRRNSMSPTSPRAFGFGEQSTRFRQRSPSQSTRDSQRSPATGPINWLRGRFSGGGNGNGPSRDERQS